MAQKALPRMPQVAELLRILQVKAKKQMSQNFLLDSSITDKFARAAGGLHDDFVIEVGGGPGALSRSLLQAGPRKLIIIEKDRRMLPMLEMLQEARPETTVIVHGDALDIDYQALIEEHWVPPTPTVRTDGIIPQPSSPLDTTGSSTTQNTSKSDIKPAIQVVGNLPFGVATPLLMQFLRMASDNSGVFCQGPAALTLAFQKEVAFRMFAPSDSKYRCRLSAAVQRYCKVKYCFDINRKSFTPPPKVETSVVHLTRHPRIEGVEDVDFDAFERVITAVFHARRRRVRHGLRSLFNNDLKITDTFLHELELERETAMQISNQDMARLAAAYTTYQELYPEQVTPVVVKKPRLMKQKELEAPPS
eukprot:m.158272 g.158272  ORF g.158272 m.158272 type:complete len:362 (+) comp16465_c0_seq1:41-1126(+)